LTARIYRTIFVAAQQIRHLFYSPNLVNFGPGVPRYHVATCVSPSLMHLFIHKNHQNYKSTKAYSIKNTHWKYYAYRT